MSRFDIEELQPPIKSIHFSVGQDVRIFSINSETSRKGTIAVIDNDLSTADVIFTSKSRDVDEECNVQLSRIRPLEKFELSFQEILSKVKSGDISTISSLDPFDIKEQGNVIFNLHDFEVACQYYTAALSSLTGCLSIQAGSDVIISSGKSQLTYLPATIICESDYSLNAYEVEYDDVSLQESESPVRLSSEIILLAVDERTASHGNNLHPISSDQKRRQLQRSLYMNLAKSHMKRGNPGWVIRYCSMSIGVVNSLMSGDRISAPTLTKFLVDAYYVRAKAFLMASRPDFAQRDVISLRSLEGGAAKAKQLEAEAAKLKVDIHKLNRRLVANLMEWVDNSMINMGDRGAADDLPLELLDA